MMATVFAIFLLSAALAADAGATDGAHGARSLLFGSMPNCNHCLAPKDVCEWDREEFRSDGETGVCLSKRPTVKELTWYNLDKGVCTVESANATHITFKFEAESGILFTSSPYRFILDPRIKSELSDMHHYVGDAVALCIHRPGGENIVHLGTVEHANDDNSGVLVGESIGGSSDGLGDAPLGCVLQEVRAMGG